MGLFKQLMIFGKTGLQGLPTRVTLSLWDTQNAPPHRVEMRDESAKSKGKPPNPTSFVVQGLLTTLLGSENTPGIDYGLLAKIQNPWRRRRTLPEGV